MSLCECGKNVEILKNPKLKSLLCAGCNVEKLMAAEKIAAYAKEKYEIALKKLQEAEKEFKEAEEEFFKANAAHAREEYKHV